jgi:flagellar protein FlgJ
MPIPIGTPVPPGLTVSESTSKVGDRQGAEPQKPLKSACRDFESLFVHYLLKQMRRTVPQDGLFGGGQAQQMYTSMMDSEVAKEISRQRGLGLAPMLYQQMMEAANETPTKK